MPYNGSGTFVRVHNWAADAAAAIKISSTRMDAECDGYATGLSNCVTRDGQSAPTANIPMGGFKHTNVASGSARAEYSAIAQIQDGSVVYGSVGGTADAVTITLTPAITAYVTGMGIMFKPTSSNTGAATVNVNGVGLKDIRYKDVALAAASWISGDIVRAEYDGTRFQMLTQPRTGLTFSGTTFTGTITFPGGLGSKWNADGLSIGSGAVVPNEGHPLTISKSWNNISRVTNSNTDAGGSALAEWWAYNGATNIKMVMTGAGYTPVGMRRADGGEISGNGAGGVTIKTTVNQPLYFGVNDVEVGNWTANTLIMGAGSSSAAVMLWARRDQNTGTAIEVDNQSAGAAALCSYFLYNGTAIASMALFGSGYTTAGLARQNGLRISNGGAGGVTIDTTVNQPVYIGVNGVEIAQFLSTGLSMSAGAGISITASGSVVYGVQSINSGNDVAITGSAARIANGGNFTGFTSGVEGKMLIIYARAGGTNQFTNESGLSTAANRFTLPGAANLTLAANSVATFMYCGTTSRWKLHSYSG